MNSKKDYSWDMGSPIRLDTIPSNALPDRFALTAPQVIIRNGSNEILLVDPHAPGTWETWMFPYASLILTRDGLTKRESTNMQHLEILKISEKSTFQDLALGLQQLRKAVESEYSAAIQSGMNNVLPQLQQGWTGSSIFENFSLKFSKTSQSYTAYWFDYFLNKVEDIHIEIPHIWISPHVLQEHLKNSESFATRKVSSNVVEALPTISRMI